MTTQEKGEKKQRGTEQADGNKFALQQRQLKERLAAARGKREQAEPNDVPGAERQVVIAEKELALFEVSHDATTGAWRSENFGSTAIKATKTEFQA